MIDTNCDQQAYDLNWELERENACHIGVLNSEMGEVRDTQISMNLRLSNIETFMGIQSAIWGVILSVFIGLVIKKMWGNGKK
jgi:hypothetical protein